MKINRLIFTLGMMAIGVTAHGQTSTISGVLLDSLTHEGEPYATIRVYKGKKSETPVAMSVTAEDGKFSQKVTGQGSYIVSEVDNTSSFRELYPTHNLFTTH